ncbi:hypothetical protein HPB47_001032 [Ixodes persulcatus]|uniref:Uncharacterized protein n=1 Tax=Ixodes persulcatus TaxID=34615 RepID=A0AC60PQE6_IXOPE|nr:hypothetical protein HPB47_001032 [Ixodes persulcatus]
MDHCELFFEVVDESPDSPTQDRLSSSSSIPFDHATGVTGIPAQCCRSLPAGSRSSVARFEAATRRLVSGRRVWGVVDRPLHRADEPAPCAGLWTRKEAGMKGPLRTAATEQLSARRYGGALQSAARRQSPALESDVAGQDRDGGRMEFGGRADPSVPGRRHAASPRGVGRGGRGAPLLRPIFMAVSGTINAETTTGVLWASMEPVRPPPVIPRHMASERVQRPAPSPPAFQSRFASLVRASDEAARTYEISSFISSKLHKGAAILSVVAPGMR